MVETALQTPEKLDIPRWFSVILELNLLELKTKAAAVANEIIRFLLKNPSSTALLKHRPSLSAQERLKRLLALNQADLLSEEEQRELDELEQIEHIMRMTKIRVKGELL